MVKKNEVKPDETTLPIVRGITLSSTGEVTVDPECEEPLCDLAVALQSPDDLPVDVEHVVAALIFAVRENQVAPDRELLGSDPALLDILRPHVQTIFQRFGGQVCDDE